MKLKLVPLLRRSLLLALPLGVLALAGCSLFSNNEKKPNVMDPPGISTATNGIVPRMQVGDIVTITFSGLPTSDDFPPQEKTIMENGTITLQDVGRIMAAGKSASELEDAIHDLYVPKIVNHLNVTVKNNGVRVYYVRGEVKMPGRIIYTDNITVSKAITAAGDFTELASRSGVTLTRANGDRFKLNLDRILDGKDPDPPVFPGDQIQVNKRLF
jgi:polysaccharide biosynthesis/export protein VpsN